MMAINSLKRLAFARKTKECERIDKTTRKQSDDF
jgi:hypothetical protein